MKKLTVKQVAARVGVSDSLVYEWCGSGLLAHYRFGRPGRRGKILIDEGELDAFLANCRQEKSPGDSPSLSELRHIKLPQLS